MSRHVRFQDPTDMGTPNNPNSNHSTPVDDHIDCTSGGNENGVCMVFVDLRHGKGAPDPDHSQCRICLEDLAAEHRTLTHSWCRTVSHEFCLDEWAQAHDTCPVCRDSQGRQLLMRNPMREFARDSYSSTGSSESLGLDWERDPEERREARDGWVQEERRRMGDGWVQGATRRTVEYRGFPPARIETRYLTRQYNAAPHEIEELEDEFSDDELSEDEVSEARGRVVQSLIEDLEDGVPLSPRSMLMHLHAIRPAFPYRRG